MRRRRSSRRVFRRVTLGRRSRRVTFRVTSSRHRPQQLATGSKRTKKQFWANAHWMKDFATKSESRRADEKTFARLPASQPFASGHVPSEIHIPLRVFRHQHPPDQETRVAKNCVSALLAHVPHRRSSVLKSCHGSVSRRLNGSRRALRRPAAAERGKTRNEVQGSWRSSRSDRAATVVSAWTRYLSSRGTASIVSTSRRQPRTRPPVGSRKVTALSWALSAR